MDGTIHVSDITIFILNILVAMGAKWIIGFLDTTRNDNNIQKNIRILHWINGSIALSYTIAFISTLWIFSVIAHSLFIILAAFLVTGVSHHLIVRLVGEIKTEIDGTSYYSEDYRADVFKAIATTLITIIAFFLILIACGAVELLQNYGFFGGLLIFLGFVLPHFFRDKVAGFQLLSSERIRPGDIVGVPEKSILGYVAQITLDDVKFLDLSDLRHITLPTAELRASTIHNYSNHPKSGLQIFVDLNISYEVDSPHVESMCRQAWELSKPQDDAKPLINYEKEPRIVIESFGDHAITYRFFLTIVSAKHLIASKHLIHHALRQASLEAHIGLNTPLTHDIQLHKQMES